MPRFSAQHKRLVLGLLWVAFFVAYLDRTNIAVAGPTMMHAFGMSTQQFGYVLAAFTAGYALTQIPGGLLADKYGAKRFLIIALLVWSVFTGVTAIAVSFAALIVIRFCFGVGEGLEQGAQFRAIGDTFSSSERSEASGIFLTALALAPAFVAPLAAFIIARVGWQPLFVWLALPGVIVAALVWRFFPAVTSDGTHDAVSTQTPQAGWSDLMRNGRAWCAFSAYLLFNVAFWGLLNWLPSYLSSERHIDLKTLGWVASVPYLCGFVGLLALGYLAKTSLYRYRPLLLAGSYLLAAVGLYVAFTAAGATMSVVGLSFAAFFLYGSFGPFWGVSLDLVHASMRGTLSGFANFGGQIGGFFSPIVVGTIVQNTASYAGGFLFMIAALVLAAITMVAVQRTQRLPVAVILVALLATGTGVASAQTNPTIRIATTPIDLGAQALYANDLGFFKRAGLNVELSVLTSGSVVASAVSGGSIDIGQANIVALAAAHVNGLPFVIVAPAGYYTSKAPTTELVVAATSHVTSAKDLDGKTIAVTALKDLNWVGIQSWLTQNGAATDSVKYIEVPQSAVCNVLTSGRADAGILSEPYLSYALESECRVLAPTHDAIAKEFLVGAWFSTTSWAQAHPDLVRRFRSVMSETARWANAHHAESEKILEKYMKLTGAPGMRRVPFADTIDRTQLQTLIDTAAKYGALKASFPATELLLPER